MFPKILVPVDLTEKNLPALELALELAKREGSEVTLLHVIETIEDAPYEDLEEFYERLQGRARETLGKWLERFLHIEISAQEAIVFGKRVDEIIRYAAEQSTDLIVLGSHRVEGGTTPRGVGTLSHRVAVFASCPVLLVK